MISIYEFAQGKNCKAVDVLFRSLSFNNLPSTNSLEEPCEGQHVRK